MACFCIDFCDLSIFGRELVIIEVILALDASYFASSYVCGVRFASWILISGHFLVCLILCRWIISCCVSWWNNFFG